MRPLRPAGDADTIVAIATAPGRSAVGIVRLSGARAFQIAHALTGRTSPGRGMRRVPAQAEDGATLDDGLGLWFEAPASYTGEPVFEFQGHGSPVALAAIVDRCVALGARLARPGEFTERAFLGGKLDLVQAEAVADLIDASSRQALLAARRVLQGAFSEPIAALRGRLIELRVLAEAALDFPEEELDVLRDQQVRERVSVLQLDLETLARRAAAGRILRDGVTVALVGAPNVGKSSLLNALVAADVALVTPIPGTTRDVVSGEAVFDGVRFRFLDTAGRRESEDPVEQLGIARGRDVEATADLVLEVVDASAPQAGSEVPFTAVAGPSPPRLRVANKVDLVATSERSGMVTDIAVSARTGAGLDRLVAGMLAAVRSGGVSSGDAVTANARQQACLDHAARALRYAVEAPEGYPELLAEHLREADEALGELLGHRVPDDLLGDIFGRFCIGK